MMFEKCSDTIKFQKINNIPSDLTKNFNIFEIKIS